MKQINKMKKKQDENPFQRYALNGGKLKFNQKVLALHNELSNKLQNLAVNPFYMGFATIYNPFNQQNKKLVAVTLDSGCDSIRAGEKDIIDVLAGYADFCNIVGANEGIATKCVIDLQIELLIIPDKMVMGRNELHPNMQKKVRMICDVTPESMTVNARYNLQEEKKKYPHVLLGYYCLKALGIVLSPPQNKIGASINTGMDEIFYPAD